MEHSQESAPCPFAFLVASNRPDMVTVIVFCPSDKENSAQTPTLFSYNAPELFERRTDGAELSIALYLVRNEVIPSMAFALLF